MCTLNNGCYSQGQRFSIEVQLLSLVLCYIRYSGGRGVASAQPLDGQFHRLLLPGHQRAALPHDAHSCPRCHSKRSSSNGFACQAHYVLLLVINSVLFPHSSS